MGWWCRTRQLAHLLRTLSLGQLALLFVTLDIEASEQGPISDTLINIVASEGATIVKCEFEPAVIYEEGQDEPTPLTEEQYNALGFGGSSVTLSGKAKARDFAAPGGKGYFTVQELLDIIAAFTREDRMESDAEWFGGVDLHHVFFEGLEEQEDGSWFVCFGS